MPRLESFTLELRTGEKGLAHVPRYSINGFEIEFDAVEGGCGPGETLRATAMPQSFPHKLILQGPEEGTWDIAGATLTFQVQGGEPYTVRLGGVTLGDRDDLNLWYERPEKVIDV
jgi:hypothetical protein